MHQRAIQNWLGEGQQFLFTTSLRNFFTTFFDLYFVEHSWNIYAHSFRIGRVFHDSYDHPPPRRGLQFSLRNRPLADPESSGWMRLASWTVKVYRYTVFLLDKPMWSCPGLVCVERNGPERLWQQFWDWTYCIMVLLTKAFHVKNMTKLRFGLSRIQGDDNWVRSNNLEDSECCECGSRLWNSGSLAWKKLHLLGGTSHLGFNTADVVPTLC